MRRNRAEKRKIIPDPLFQSERVAQFINYVMRSGKKAVAQNIVYGALNIVVQRRDGINKTIWDDADARQAALKYFEEVLDAVGPTVEVRPRRVGGATYQVPIEVKFERRIALAMRWLIGQANMRKEKGMEEKLACEMIDALNDQGGAVEMRRNAHRMAKANEAFAHYQW